MTHLNDTRALDQVFCHACGIPIDVERDDTLVESLSDRPMHDRRTLFWHQDCFNEFLDRGEET